MPSWDSTTHVSPHLAWRELACRDARHTPYPEPSRTTRAPILAATFEAIRAAVGHRPIVIGSAYRTRRHNTAVGGAADSMHLYGLALDLHRPTHVSLEELHDAAARVLDGCGGLVWYPWGVHIDRRDVLGRAVARGDFR